MPWLRDIADRKLGTFEPASGYPSIATLIGRPINVAIIRECWDEIVRLTASIRAKTVLPSVMLCKLAGHQRQNHLDFALQEIGRIERAIFTLDWLESKALRQQCQAGLNRGEARHSLAQAVFAHRQGRMSDRTFESQAFKASGLNLATAAIVYWNTLYMSRAVDHLRATGIAVPDHLLAHDSPLGWRHISLTGDYLWQEVTRRHGGDGFMPLNIPAGRLQGDASWEAAGKMFKAQLPSAQWVGTIQSVRQPLGRVQSRILQSAVPTKTLPGAPSGDYQVLQFQTRLANKSCLTRRVATLSHRLSRWSGNLPDSSASAKRGTMHSAMTSYARKSGGNRPCHDEYTSRTRWP